MTKEDRIYLMDLIPKKCSIDQRKDNGNDRSMTNRNGKKGKVTNGNGKSGNNGGNGNGNGNGGRGGSRIFFRRGCTRFLLYFNQLQ